MLTSKAWSIPPWVSSRCYCLGTESARAILTNARWWTNIVLEGASAELWNLLPSRFSLADLGSGFQSIGIDLADAESRTELVNFLENLNSEGLLWSDTESNPTPNPSNDALNVPSGATADAVEADFYDWLADQGILPSALVELTYRCNQRCVHCFNPGAARAADETPHRRHEELTTGEICRLLADLAEMGAFTLTFSGGEPSLCVDLIDVLTEAKALGFSFNVFSNGQLAESLLSRICSLWPRTFGISLYSAVPEIHDATTGVTGSFHRALESLRFIAESGVRATLKCPLLAHTVFGYKRLIELSEMLNALPQIDFQITAGMDGDDRCTIHQIDDASILKLIMTDPRVAMHVASDSPQSGRQNRPMDGPVCGAGRYTVSVAPDGAVYPCNGLPLIVGNVRTQGIRDIWENSAILSAWRSVTLRDFDECGLYAHCSYCNHCPGMAMADTGDLLAVPRTCCTVARARMELSNEIQEGRSPTVDAAPTFGFDTSVRLPHPPPPRRSLDALPSDPRTISGQTFATKLLQIRREGNPQRRSRDFERGSPAHQDVKESDLDRASRLRDLGR